MAPIRRYLRITKYSVLECRIYLDNPALAQSWLLNPRDPVLPKIIQSVRPLVLPKLREERERAKKRSTRKKGIKDVVIEDDFEVSIFLTETSTRHSLLTKHKLFHDTTQTKLTSNSGRLVAASIEAPIEIGDFDAAVEPITLRHEDSDDEDAAAALAAIPPAPAAGTRRPKRARRNTAQTLYEEDDDDNHVEIMDDSDQDDMDTDDAESNYSGTAASTGQQPPAKRRKEVAGNDVGDGGDKKKPAMDISYEGFSIYGRVLCLVVKRRDVPNAAGRSGAASSSLGADGHSKAKQSGPGGGGQAMMENFIISTQIPVGDDGP